MWRYRGTPPYLTQQAKRLGISQVLADRARHNQEIHRCSVLLSQLCERYHRARTEDGRPVFGGAELAQIVGTLGQVEQECAKLHLLAGTAAEMLREASEAFNVSQSPGHFAVTCDFDHPVIPLPLGDGTVGVTAPRTAAKAR
jgi:hypothetical protein